MSLNLSKKAKSELIFWGIAVGSVIFLFFTPWGMKVRFWMTSMWLGSPDVADSLIDEKLALGMDWRVISDKGEEIWIGEIDQPIFLNIWATWCGPCRSELSSILSLRDKYKDKVAFLLVSPSENLETIQAFTKDEGWEFSAYVNGGEIPEVLRTGVFPTTFIINSDKQVIHKFEGAFDWDSESVHEMLDKL